MNKLKISAIICTYNRCNLLNSAIMSLINQTIDKSMYEIIIVDNNSTDKTKELVEEYLPETNIRYIFEPKLGLSHARNAGFKNARANFVAYMDDDAKADKDWVRKIIQVFETVLPSPSAVGGRILPYYLSKKPNWFLDTYEIRTWGEKSGFLQMPRASHGFSGSNMAFPKKILEQYGGFSPNLGMIGRKVGVAEETVLFYRIYKCLPHFWYDTEIKVMHLVSKRNMKIWYRLKRTFISNIISIKIEKIKPTFFSVIRILLSIGIQSIALLFKVRWWEEHWQRSFLQRTISITRSFGKLKGMFQNRRRKMTKGK